MVFSSFSDRVQSARAVSLRSFPPSSVYINSSIPHPILIPFLHHHTLTLQTSSNICNFNNFHKPTSNNNHQTITMDSIKQGANYVGEKVQQATSGASKEANKNVAKDSNAPVGTR